MSVIIETAWSKKISTLADELNSDVDRGLSSNEVERRIGLYGSNSLKDTSVRPVILLFVAQFRSPLILILLSAMGVTFFFHEYVDAIFIGLAVTVSIGLGWFQEYKAERATAALRSYIEERVRVVRDGRETEIDAKSIVPGDIVVLRSGERISADGRLIETHDLYIDESILTGESLPVSKDPAENSIDTPLPERTSMVFGGTYVAEGQGRAVITATGLTSEFGQIANAVLSQQADPTPLQKAVSLMGWAITIVTLVLLVFVYSLGISRGLPPLEIFLIAVAIAVGAIPEALPPGLTAILAVGVERIAKRGGIVRSLLAAETLGSATLVITDKTGTLTTGALELVEILSIDSLLKDTKTTEEEKRKLLSLAVVNTNVIITDPSKPPQDWDISGRHLDVGIAKAAALLGIHVPNILAEAKPVKLFSSAHKYSIFSHEGKSVVLGAPDVLLKHSSLGSEQTKSLATLIERYSQAGKRLLAVGTTKHDKGNHLAVNLEGLLVFYDPLRSNMKESIKAIEAGGVRVVMATGDLPGTAESVARELGWQVTEQQVLTGESMHALTDAELVERLRFIRIFARMTPEDKYRLIELFQANGEVVAMLGDGVNDAPSLRAADIGVAVGSGTDVAKGVADLVLLEDDFNIIKAAIEEGKLILANIRKMFVYLMSNCLDEVVLLGGSLALGFSLPLSPLQVIFVNFATGSIPAVAYAFDRERSRYKTGEHAILSREVLTLSFGIGILSSCMLLALYTWLIKVGFDSAAGRTFLFACFSSYILFVAFSFRNLHRSLFSYPTFTNPILNIGVILGLIQIALTIYLPFFQTLFGTVALGATWLVWLLVWIIVNVSLVEAAKWTLARRA